MMRTRQSNVRPWTARRVGLTGVLAAVAALALGACSSGASADAGEDFSVELGEPPVFDGCGSSGDDLSYTWTIVEAPDDMAEDVGKVLRQSIGECSFTLESDMEVADTGVWTIELLVTDGVT
ncbi:MAG: hypothetical protein AAFN30_14055, partial [Actinomycetota bacterium]